MSGVKDIVVDKHMHNSVSCCVVATNDPVKALFVEERKSGCCGCCADSLTLFNQMWSPAQ